jgi:hypothetical protein
LFALIVPVSYHHWLCIAKSFMLVKSFLEGWMSGLSHTPGKRT